MGVYNFVVNTGVVIPDTSDIRNDVITEFREIFGSDFITDAESPEGQWIDSETTSRQSVARNNASVANQLNPDLAGGPFFDAIWALTGGQRTQATSSTVSATLTGTAGTFIPVGSIARTTAGDEFRTTTPVVIPSSGSMTGVEFASVETGPIAAGANTLTAIVTNILGWETVTNPAAATLGRVTQSDADARNERRRTLGLQGRSISEAVTSNVNQIEGVRSLQFRENVTNMTQTIDGITLVAHSIWLAVEGGANNDIAQTLLRTKTAGANWNGTTSVMVTDAFSGQTYTVMFDRPTAINMLVRVTIQGSSTVEDPGEAIRDSVIRYANGEIQGEDGFSIGTDVSPFELSSAINFDNPSLFITNVEVAMKSETPDYSNDTFTIAINQLAAIEFRTDITVVIMS